MQRNLVHSSRIRSVGWGNNVLEIEFPDGAIYHYENVSYIEYVAFINSPSLGSSLTRLEKTHTYYPVN